ncbi:MAG: TolC family protein [Tepidisphaeraceae bacterium]
MMRWTRWAALATLVLAGCHVDQAREVAEYRRLLDAPDLVPSTQPDQPVSLPEVLRRANRSSDDLAVEGEAYYRVLNERRRAIANFLPTIDFAPTYARRDSAGSSNSAGNTAKSVLDAPVDLSVNLFNGFGDVNRAWAADYRIEEAKQRLLDAQQTLLLDVARLHYGVLISESSLAVIEQSLVAQEERCVTHAADSTPVWLGLWTCHRLKRKLPKRVCSGSTRGEILIPGGRRCLTSPPRRWTPPY